MRYSKKYMEDAESDQWHSQNATKDSHYYNHYSLVNSI